MTTMTTVAFAPDRGVQAVQAAAERPDFTPRRKTHWLTQQLPKNGDSVRLRFITALDDLPTVAQHEFAPTKKGPSSATNWPETMSATCRMARAFQGGYPDCYLCDNPPPSKWDVAKTVKAVDKTWALACLRKLDEKTGVVRDVARKVVVNDDKGEPVEKLERALIVVCMKPSNFWKNLLVQATHLGSLCDRDFTITRVGESKKTEYVPMYEDKDTVLNPANPDGDGKKIKWSNYLTDATDQELHLDTLIASSATDEYYARFYDKRYTVTDAGLIVPSGDGAPGSAQAAAAEATSAEKVRLMREDLGIAEAAPEPEEEYPF